MEKRKMEDPVMTKRLIAIISLLCMVVGLAGCNVNLRDTVEGNEEKMPAFDISSDLIGTVTGVSGNRYTVTVLEDNAQYDKDDVVYVTYQPEEDGVSLKAGDIINAHYNYITDVSSISGIPHIITDAVSILPEYTPPETTVEPTVETTVETTEAPVETITETTEATE